MREVPLVASENLQNILRCKRCTHTLVARTLHTRCTHAAHTLHSHCTHQDDSKATLTFCRQSAHFRKPSLVSANLRPTPRPLAKAASRNAAAFATAQLYPVFAASRHPAVALQCTGLLETTALISPPRTRCPPTPLLDDWDPVEWDLASSLVCSGTKHRSVAGCCHAAFPPVLFVSLAGCGNWRAEQSSAVSGGATVLPTTIPAAACPLACPPAIVSGSMLGMSSLRPPRRTGNGIKLGACSTIGAARVQPEKQLKSARISLLPSGVLLLNSKLANGT